MKIAVITHGRTGSSSLTEAMAEALGYELFIEPRNTELWIDWNKSDLPDLETIPENSIVKHIHYQDMDWSYEKIQEFDKIFVLFRSDIRQTLKSYDNAMQHGFDFVKYKDKKLFSVNRREFFYAFDCYRTLMLFYSDYNHSIDGKRDERERKKVSLIWYEDFFEVDKETCWMNVNKMKIGITRDRFDIVYDKWLDPKHRYLQKMEES